MVTYINSHKLKDPIGFLYKLYVDGTLRMIRRDNSRFTPCNINCRNCSVSVICHSEVGTIPHFDKEDLEVFLDKYPEARIIL